MVSAEIEVTDGWYAVKATLDLPLQELVYQSKLYIGQKLHVLWSKIVGSGTMLFFNI